MATREEVNNFIAKLSKLAIAEAKKRDKWVLPSVCIAQAALETGWGTSSLMKKANAYFGIKATGWRGKVFNSATLECYDGKTYTNVNACFRAYDSVSESVADYFDLITGAERYAGAVNNADALSAIIAIKKGGYATDPTYVDKVINIVNSYDLTQYDAEITGKKTEKPAENHSAYTVKRGDSLWAIAEKFLGNGARYPEIKELNKLTSNTIYAGQTLKIPAKDKAEQKPDSSKNSAKNPVATAIKKGDTVRVINPILYGTSKTFKLWYEKYTVMDLVGDRAVIGVNGVVTAAINVKHLTRA